MILLIFPLAVMLVLTIFSLIFSSTYVSYSASNLINTDAIINGTTTNLIVGEATNFNIDVLVGALTWVIVIIILAGATGINVLGSGLTSASVRLIVVGTAWSSAFIFLSVVSFSLIALIPYNLGSLLFVLLSILYAMGIFKQLAGGSS
ncbi:MAG: hypothetical protein ACW981_21095 [Candidatus Hodarchaeales archaeon]|jgi:hypothetical protein